MEHRINHSPETSARMDKLGLRKYPNLIVLRYAQLFLVLGDKRNMRALLTRAVAAYCEAQEKRRRPSGPLGYDAAIRVRSVKP
jgi:hypothetical protein